MTERPEGGWKVDRVMTHPGAVLREDYMVPLGLTVAVLAERLHVTRSVLQDIVEEHAPITAEMALRLARCFQGTPQIWMNLQAQHDLSKAEFEAGTQVMDEVQPLPSMAA